MGYQIDKMEGIGLHRAPDGETVLTLVSADSFSIVQRNLLLQFAIVGELIPAQAGIQLDLSKGM